LKNRSGVERPHSKKDRYRECCREKARRYVLACGVGLRVVGRVHRLDRVKSVLLETMDDAVFGVGYGL
jgi:hypothetical protein